MKTYLQKFVHRGLIFGGFGPIIMGIIYCILGKTIENFSISGTEAFCAILSTYLLAFVQAGASVFNQIEHWPISKSLLFHFATLYVAYALCYVVNTWIPFKATVLLLFTLIFAAVYCIIWLTVYIIIRSTSRKLNEKLAQQ